MELRLDDRAALVVIDVQRGFDSPVWGPRNNEACEANVADLIDEWRRAGRPVVFVRHDSTEPGSPLRPGTEGNAFKDVITGDPDLLVAKSVNSAFLGEPDLHGWLAQQGIRGLVVCGIQTNFCVETTARMGGNMGYDTYFVLDATHTFDQKAWDDGSTITADELARVTASNLQPEFATVVTTAQMIEMSRMSAASPPAGAALG